LARALNGKKFSKLNVSRTYFGNWLRDYSQAIDVGTVKSVSAEAIRLLLGVLGFMTFGYGSGEFEVTAKRLGCYRPEDHIDNPKNYADNEDATQYDTRLRAPVDERTELAVDPESGMKNYIANERAGIMTSAQHVRKLFTECIQLGRRYARDQNKPDKYEALRLLGTGLHCLEGRLAPFPSAIAGSLRRKLPRLTPPLLKPRTQPDSKSTSRCVVQSNCSSFILARLEAPANQYGFSW